MPEVEKQEPMAAKKKTAGPYPDKYKREIVQRILVGKRDKTETITAIAKDIKISQNTLYQWLKAAKKGEPRASRKVKGNGVARETTEAPSAPPIKAQIEGALAAVEQAGFTIKALRRALFGG